MRLSITIGRPEAASTCFGPFGFAGVADTVVGGLACVQGCETQSPSPHSATLICTGDKQMLLNDNVPILRKTLFEAAPWQGLFLLVLCQHDSDVPGQGYSYSKDLGLLYTQHRPLWVHACLRLGRGCFFRRSASRTRVRLARDILRITGYCINNIDLYG